jgi:non-specific serine/threonine protein kinase
LITEGDSVSGRTAGRSTGAAATPSSRAHVGAEPGIHGLSDFTEIGRSEAAVVHRARQAALNRFVAVKIFSDDPAGHDRFERERALAGALSGHPHIVTVHSAGITPVGAPYLVREYLRRGTVAEHVHRHGPLPPAEALRVAAQLASALAAAHRLEVAHRDVHPGNVLVSDHGGAVLTGFGAPFDKSAAALLPRHPAEVLFTAPEVLDGDTAGSAADLYAWAATVHSLLTGQPPFPARPGDGFASVYIRIVSQPAPALPAEVPAVLRDLVAAGLAKDAADRPADAAAVAETLARVAALETAAPGLREPSGQAVADRGLIHLLPRPRRR